LLREIDLDDLTFDRLVQIIRLKKKKKIHTDLGNENNFHKGKEGKRERKRERGKEGKKMGKKGEMDI
jgi:hypothetical protein